ncbi:putative defensin-like protein 110 [Brassica rapa]|uniref:putative defensin-like protein 110 n=1 Tax=Brassica campestris TaxID=3711 RepID=UPI00142D2957|nr:putative defensin-like protein 110 [Brassica rapa]
MAITKKFLVAFVLTILCVISFLRCHKTSDRTSGTDLLNSLLPFFLYYFCECVYTGVMIIISIGFGVESDYNCYTVAPCEGGGERGCTAFCKRMKLIPMPGRGVCNAENVCCCAIN